MKTTRESVGKLKRKLDAVYSQYIRLKHADDAGYAECVSCHRKYHWKSIQCGHFVSRRYSNTRYNERNTKPQCMGCNMFRGGNHANFAESLIQEYGENIIKELAKESNTLKQFTPKELKEMIEAYKNKLQSFHV